MRNSPEFTPPWEARRGMARRACSSRMPPRCEAPFDLLGARLRAGVGSARALIESKRARCRARPESPQVSKALADVIGERAVNAPDRAAYLASDARLSWAEYDALSQRFAQLLLSLGLECEERVAVLLPDGPGVHIAYLAAEKGGLRRRGEP
jgi:non-ribosomal peptide synthetase component F